MAAPGPIYAITPQEHVKYHQLFVQYDTNADGLLSGAESVTVFRQSGLDQTILRNIWTLADDDKDNQLNPKEFCVGFHLILCISKKKLPLPATLPPELKYFLLHAPAVPVLPTAAPTVNVPTQLVVPTGAGISHPPTAAAAAAAAAVPVPVASTAASPWSSPAPAGGVGGPPVQVVSQPAPHKPVSVSSAFEDFDAPLPDAPVPSLNDFSSTPTAPAPVVGPSVAAPPAAATNSFSASTSATLNPVKAAGAPSIQSDFVSTGSSKPPSFSSPSVPSAGPALPVKPSTFSHSSVSAVEEAELNSGISTFKEAAKRSLSVHEDSLNHDDKTAVSLKYIVQRLGQEKVALNAAISSAEKSAHDSHAKVAAAVSDLQELEMQLDQLRTRLEATRRQVHENQSNLQSKEVVKMQLLNDINLAKEQLSTAVAELNVLAGQGKLLETQKAALAAELGATSESLRQSKDQAAGLKADLETLQSVSAALQKNRLAIERQVSGVRSENQKLQAEIEAQRRSVASQKAELAGIQSENSRLEAENHKAKQQIADLTNSLNDALLTAAEATSAKRASVSPREVSLPTVESGVSKVTTKTSNASTLEHAGGKSESSVTSVAPPAPAAKSDFDDFAAPPAATSTFHDDFGSATPSPPVRSSGFDDFAEAATATATDKPSSGFDDFDASSGSSSSGFDDFGVSSSTPAKEKPSSANFDDFDASGPPSSGFDDFGVSSSTLAKEKHLSANFDDFGVAASASSGFDDFGATAASTSNSNAAAVFDDFGADSSFSQSHGFDDFGTPTPTGAPAASFDDFGSSASAATVPVSSSSGFDDFDIPAQAAQSSGFDDFGGTSSASSAAPTGFDDFGTTASSPRSSGFDDFANSSSATSGAPATTDDFASAAQIGGGSSSHKTSDSGGGGFDDFGATASSGFDDFADVGSARSKDAFDDFGAITTTSAVSEATPRSTAGANDLGASFVVVSSSGFDDFASPSSSHGANFDDFGDATPASAASFAAFDSHDVSSSFALSSNSTGFDDFGAPPSASSNNGFADFGDAKTKTVDFDDFGSSTF